MKMKILIVILILAASAFMGGKEVYGSTSSPVLEQPKPDVSAILKPLDNTNISFFRVWKIHKVAGYGRVSAGEEVGRKSLGEKVLFGPEDAIIANNQIKPVFYYRIHISKDDFFKYYWVNTEHLGINKPEVEIILISANDRLHKANWRHEYKFVIKDEKSILINCENVWFELVRDDT